MSGKSYVTIEQQMCPVCGKVQDSGAILLDQRLRERFNQHTTTGYGMCEEHEKLRQYGFIALVVVDETKSPVTGSTLHTQDAYRTGEVINIKAAALKDMLSDKAKYPNKGMAFIPQTFADVLRKKVEG